MELKFGNSIAKGPKHVMDGYNKTESMKEIRSKCLFPTIKDVSNIALNSLVGKLL